MNLGQALDSTYGFGFLNALFETTWSNPPGIANLLTWNFFGPYRFGTLVCLMILYTGSFIVLYRSGKREDANFTRNKKTFLWVGLIILAVALLMPWAIYYPSKITFINYRLVSMSMFLLFPIIPRCFFLNQAQKWIVIILCFSHFFLLSLNTYRYQAETRDPIELLSIIPAQKVLMSCCEEKIRDVAKFGRLLGCFTVDFAF